jgi:hypothetical protein
MTRISPPESDPYAHIRLFTDRDVRLRLRGIFGRPVGATGVITGGAHLCADRRKVLFAKPVKCLGAALNSRAKFGIDSSTHTAYLNPVEPFSDTLILALRCR